MYVQYCGLCFICVYTHTHIHIHVYTHIHITHVRTHTCTHTHTRAHAHTCARTHTHTHTLTHTHSHTHTLTHTHTLQLVVSPPVISPSMFVQVVRLLSTLCASCPVLAVELLKLSTYMCTISYTPAPPPHSHHDTSIVYMYVASRIQGSFNTLDHDFNPASPTPKSRIPGHTWIPSAAL